MIPQNRVLLIFVIPYYSLFLLGFGCGTEPAPSNTGQPPEAPIRYTLTVELSGQGTVDPPSQSFQNGEIVTLVAIPSEGWLFDHWEGSATGTDTSISIIMDQPKTITAVFMRMATLADFQQATWLVLALNDTSSLTATAFAVAPTLLATNAHVAQGIKEIFLGSNPVAWVFQHETGLQRNITKVWSHPGYDPTSIIPTPDVGLLEVDQNLTQLLDVSGSVPPFDVFDEVSLCGFPASVTSLIDLIGLITTGQFFPRATCLHGTISAIRPLDPGVPITEENAILIQYDLPTVPGTSGSAVFDGRGKVVGVHALGITGGGDFNFAIRIDLLRNLLTVANNGGVEGIVLADIEPLANCDTTYLNQAFGFGFNPPPGWSGPVQQDLVDFNHLSNEDFYAPGGSQNGLISADVFRNFDTSPDRWIQFQISEGSTLLVNEQFMTTNGGVAYYLAFERPDGDLWVESDVYEGGLNFVLLAPIFPTDPQSLVDAIAVSLVSICVEKGSTALKTVVGSLPVPSLEMRSISLKLAEAARRVD
jgi:hypothetical protein